MKRIIFSLCILIGLSFSFRAQVPAAFKYQAILRSDTGGLLANKAVSIRITLLQGGSGGLPVYTETHSVSSNDQGMVNLNIGMGLTMDNFNSINWSAGNIYLKTEIDANGGANYQGMGVSQLLAVPYALYAQAGNQGPAGPPGPAGTTSWTDGSGIVTTSANVGIGTSTPGGKLIVTADASVNPDSALFEVRNRLGETVFAVYEDGVRVYIPENAIKGGKGGFAVGGRSGAKGGVDDIFVVYPDSVRVVINESITKGGKGGFAVGGRTKTGKGGVNDILTANLDSVRIYVGDPLIKGGRGGFAVGGRSGSKGEENHILLVNTDSVRVYVPNTVKKGGRGGFAVGGRSSGKGSGDLLMVNPIKTEVHGSSDAFSVYSGIDTALSVQQSQIGAASYLRISPTNFFIGQESGLMSTGLYNSFIGFQSGKTNIAGAYNVFTGYQTGMSNNDGSYNVFMGWKAGLNNTSSFYNTYIGAHAGYQNPIGMYNTAVGCNSSVYMEFGESNAFLGLNTGMNIENGSNNTFIGSNAGLGGDLHPGSGETANNNTFVGFETGHYISTGNYNTLIGDYSGYNLATGSNNVFVGHEAGKNETGSNRLYIANSALTNPLLFGEFDSARLVINGTKSDNVSKSTFFVNGKSGGTTAWTTPSDARLKKNITTIQDPLEKVKHLRGVNFEWKDPSDRESGRRMGFIAQEVQLVVPEVVDKSGDYYSMQYAPVTALLVEAIKEQQKMIEELKTEIEQLKQKK